jgi:hypothetical protein
VAQSNDATADDEMIFRSRAGNDRHNEIAIARLTSGLDNKTAYREIARLLRDAGYRGAYLISMRDGVWRERANLP